MDNVNMQSNNVAPATLVKKNNSTRNLAIGCCLVILVLLCICCSAVLLIFGGSFSVLNNEYSRVQPVFNSICKLDVNNSREVRNVYENNLSEGFRKATSLLEFDQFLSENATYLNQCGIFSSKELDIVKLIEMGNSVAASTSNGVDTFTIKNKTKDDAEVITILIKEDGLWKILSIKINPI